MKKQKYHKGDYVMIINDCEAIILFSYKDKFGYGDVNDYGIHIKNRGPVAWFDEKQLNLIELNRLDLLEIWEKERQDEINLKSNLDWIFENSESVLKNPHGASISKLAKCFGLNSLWESNGEGFIWNQNAMSTLALAESFLKEKNKEGWLEFCTNLKTKFTQSL